MCTHLPQHPVQKQQPAKRPDRMWRRLIATVNATLAGQESAGTLPGDGGAGRRQLGLFPLTSGSWGPVLTLRPADSPHRAHPPRWPLQSHGLSSMPPCATLVDPPKPASTLSPYRSHSSTEASRGAVCPGDASEILSPADLIPKQLERWLLASYYPHSTAQIHKNTPQVSCKKKKAYLFLLEGHALGFHTSRACGGLSGNVGQGMPFFCSLLILLQLTGTHPPTPQKGAQSLV